MATPKAKKAMAPQTTEARRSAKEEKGSRRGGVTLLLSLGTILVALVAVQAGLAGSSLDLEAWKAKRVLVLTAHPDDEAMFFAPAILALTQAGVSVWAMCLSTGNADGLGATRRQELLESYEMLGVPRDRVMSIDDERLQDGMQTAWWDLLIVDYIDKFYKRAGPFDVLLTFDGRGVSSHPNHVACHDAAKELSTYTPHDKSTTAIRGPIYALQTVSPAPLKFLGLVHAILQASVHRSRSRQMRNDDDAGLHFFSSPGAYVRTLRAMAKHRSQLVWFRLLYVLFSSHMYASTFDEVLPPASASGVGN